MTLVRGESHINHADTSIPSSAVDTEETIEFIASYT